MPRAHLLATAVSAALVLVPAGPAGAQDDAPWREALANEGLAAAEARLADEEANAETAFLLGGVRFLRAVETILQTRYAHYTGALPFAPGMATPIPENPDAAFDPAFLEIAMSGALTHLSGAEAALAQAVDGDFAVEVQIGDIWFDIDADGQASEWEYLGGFISPPGDRPITPPGDGVKTPETTADAPTGVVRFDSADADWLKAYVHLISGAAELTLAVDPTPAIETVSEGRAALNELGDLSGFGLPGENWVDTFAATLVALRGVPDAERTRAAHDHFRAVITHNRAFWSKVEQETDDDLEWLPNARQTSAFGVSVSDEMATGWKAILSDFEAVLEGEKLIPYWRVESDGPERIGVNVARFLQDPGEMDLILWIQGAAAAPYLEVGEIAEMSSWNRFQRLAGGNSFLFAAWMN